MAQYLDKINKLASIAGYSVDPLDRAALTILENEIANISADKAAKREALNIVTDELEKAKLELMTLKDEERHLDTDIEDQVKNCHKKQDILRTYMDTVESREEFLLNKVVKEIELHNKIFYDQLKEVHDRAFEINKDLEQMRQLQRECDELRQKAAP